MTSSRSSKIKQILFSKPVIAILIILVVFIGTLEFKQFQKRSKYNKEIAELQKQEQELVAKNQTLQDSLDYFNNNEYKEKIARQQLNLKKDGEIVVNYPAIKENTEQHEQKPPEPKNPEKWWNYFFNKQN